MKRFFRVPRTLLIPAVALLSATLQADIIVLKSGDRIDGKIISEDAASFTIDYQLTPKIRDKKVVQKSDIKEVTRFTPAQEEFIAKDLAKHENSPDLMTASDYESIIQDSLRTFVARFPGTPEAKKVEDIIAKLSDEKTKVLSGQLKVEGKWLDEATVKREQYNIEAYRLRRAMKEKAADVSGDHAMPKEIGALRQFDALRTTHPASLHYLQAIAEAEEILEKYEKRLNAMLAEYPVLKADREKALAALQGSELERVRNAIEAEQNAFKANIAEQKKNKVKWQDVYKYDQPSITAAQAAVLKEKTELKNINKTALQNEIENLNAAIRYIADGNAAEAEAVMGRLRPTKSSLLNKKVFDEFDKKLKELQLKITKEARAAKAAAAATPGTAPGATGEGSEKNPLAEELKKKEEAKARTKPGRRPLLPPPPPPSRSPRPPSRRSRPCCKRSTATSRSLAGAFSWC
jgi:hypothetical protein